MKKILAFDTSNNSCSVAISEGQNIIAYLEEPRPSMQAERIILMIEEALKIAKLAYQNLDYLALTKGPGSFTGIRIGLAAAKGILLATNMKAVAVTNFEIMHRRAKIQITDYDKIYIFINAFRNQLYMQIFGHDNNISKPELVDFDLAVELLAKTSGKIICAGSGVELIYQQIKFLNNLTILPRFTKIKAMQICRYVDEILDDHKYQLNNALEPLYIRPPDAKVKQ